MTPDAEFERIGVEDAELYIEHLARGCQLERVRHGWIDRDCSLYLETVAR